MARRNTHKKDELKALILTAAKDIIQEEGSSEMTARKIASRIGYTVGTLYNFFLSRDDIILHVNGLTLDALTLTLEEITAQHPGHLTELGYGYIGFAQENYPLWHLLFEHNIPKENYPGWYLEKIDRLFILIEKNLTPFMPDNKETIKRTARILWAGLQGIAILSLNGRLDVTGAESARILTESFISTYMKKCN